MENNYERSGVYLIMCVPNGKVYVGSSNSLPTRRNQHFRKLTTGTHHSKRLQKDYDEYGPEAFKWKVILKNVQPKDLMYWEQVWLDILKAYHQDYGFNINRYARGGGRRHSEETKKKIGAAGKGQCRYKGYLPTEATRRLISEKLRGHKRTYGQVHSDETRQKIREAVAGRKQSKEACEKRNHTLRNKELKCRKLNREEVRQIRASEDTYKALGAKYGVSATAIYYIKKNMTWKEI